MTGTEGQPKQRRGPIGDLGIAFGFLTVLPVPTRGGDGPAGYGRAFSWFPVVGLALGAVMAAAGLLLSLFFPAGVSAALVVALWVFLTGGLHLDGLMDSCDGLLCSKPPDERLAVMRDSRVGAFGVLGAVVVLLVKYSAIAALFELSAVPLISALVAAPVLGRWAMALTVVAFPYHRHGDTLGGTFTAGVGRRQLVFASVSGLAVIGGLAAFQGSLAPFAALAAGAIAAVAVAWFALSRLPGLTGDVYGATCEAVEAAALVALVGVVGWVL
ncbi:MAG: adenosylcobinamide-GDP ribazoletransferase [Actinomycetota bacterium]|jgi:cobalamin 5'-phosphate synthase/cobalamin synthase|nr:adenosylcobinamide-GDP ribazoletransferase [Actinomycetota bacterium]